MVGIYYTEARKKAIKKYFDKLKAEGRHDHMELMKKQEPE